MHKGISNNKCDRQNYLNSKSDKTTTSGAVSQLMSLNLEARVLLEEHFPLTDNKSAKSKAKGLLAELDKVIPEASKLPDELRYELRNNHAWLKVMAEPNPLN